MKTQICPIGVQRCGPSGSKNTLKGLKTPKKLKPQSFNEKKIGFTIFEKLLTNLSGIFQDFSAIKLVFRETTRKLMANPREYL